VTRTSAAEFVAEDEGEGGLAEAGRAGEEDVIERLAAALGGADHHLQALDRLRLAGEIREGQRSQRGLGRRNGRGERGGEKTGAFGRRVRSGHRGAEVF